MALVERPVIYSVIRQIQDATGISSKTQVRYFGEDAKAAQFNSTMTTDPVIHNLWPIVEALTIEVESDFRPEALLTMVINQPDVPFIFLDTDLGFYIKPAYSTEDVTIRFKYKARDRNQAIKWRNEIRTRVGMNRYNLMHTLTYSYHIPDTYIGLIKDVHALREAIGGYGDDFGTYFTNHTTNRLTVLSNQSGSQTLYAVSEQQAGIVGSFDFDGFPDKPQREGENDNHEISFSYKFRYEKPIEAVCRYPFLVHQQFLEEKYIPKPAYDLVRVFKLLTSSGADIASFQIDNQNDRAIADRGIIIPNFDDFLPAFIPPFTLKVLTALVTITDTDKRSLLNLRELGDFNFRSEVLAFLVGEAPFMTTVTNSVFYCQLYENENALADPSISIDSNLNVVSLTDLDIRKQYRIRLSLVGDFSMVTSQGLARLKAATAAMPTILNAINAALSNSGNQANLFKNSLSVNDYRQLGIQGPGMNGLGRSLVQYLYVQAYNQDQFTPPVPATPDANTTALPNAISFGNIGSGSP